MKYKLLLTVFLLFLFNKNIFSQRQANIWYFAENAGINFNVNPPALLTDGTIQSDTSGNSEGCSSLSDSSGNLLLYASPISIWNRNHQVMPNGFGLMGGISSTQGVLILPIPGSSELYYVFTLDEFQNNLANGLRYSIVDMCLDNGLGDVVSGQKNILLLDSTGEKMAATFHSNGNDIWLVTRKQYTNQFYSYLITSSGISNPVISAIGWSDTAGVVENAIGQMKISPNGKKIAFAVSNQYPNVAQLFDFNNTTGAISNLVDLPVAELGGFLYGVAFSPDNSKLYFTGLPPTGLTQFDLSNPDPASVANSLTDIQWVNDSNVSYGGTGLQLAPDGKIYVVGGNGINVVTNPNLEGNACNYVANVFNVDASYTLPEFIDNFKYKTGKQPICDPSGGSTVDTTDYSCYLSTKIKVSPNPFGNQLIITSQPMDCKVVMNLYNDLGQLIIKEKLIESGVNEMETGNLSSAVYECEFFSDDGSRFTVKVLKKQL